ncbi:MAG: acetate kinase [Gammaproteobacteria bacterium]
MKVLVLNSGSSSIKYRFFDMAGETVLASGVVERIGEAGSGFVHESRGSRQQFAEAVPDHASGFARIMELLGDAGSPDAIGHRVVHGGDRFRAPVQIDAQVIEVVRSLVPLAPLHNPANLTGIEAAMDALQGVPQVAVFDTAFHQTMPPHAYRYAVPARWYTGLGLRRYGFHGTSHAYVSRQAAAALGRPPGELRLVVLHLGNGASAAAVRHGESVDTSMGLTPLEGLVMGTRCGDVDPAVFGFLSRRAGMTLEEVEQALNEDSGLKGLCGANDMREIEDMAAAGNGQATLALDLFCYRARKYVGAYAAAMGGLDALVFTAGIGQRSAEVRARTCDGLEVLGLELDPARNARPGELPAAVHSDDSAVAVLVIATNEELAIARETVACLDGSR